MKKKQHKFQFKLDTETNDLCIYLIKVYIIKPLIDWVISRITIEKSENDNARQVISKEEGNFSHGRSRIEDTEDPPSSLLAS